MKTLYVYILLFFTYSLAYSGTIDPSVPDSKYIEYGSKHKCVLPIVGLIDSKLNTYFKGSCIVIDEYHILTAAHVVYGSQNQEVIFNEKPYKCAIIAIHANYHEDKVGFNDIAIGRLSEPLKLDFYPELYKDKDEVGKICSIAGYGFTGTFKTGCQLKNFDNKKRAGSNFVDGVENNVLTFSVHNGKKTSLEYMICPGDSGGGLFIDQKLAGIHSYVYATDGSSNSDYGDVGCSTRISDYIEWINKTKKTMEKLNAIQKER